MLAITRAAQLESNLEKAQISRLEHTSHRLENEKGRESDHSILLSTEEKEQSLKHSNLVQY